MRKIILYMFTTIDGFISGINGEFDDYEPSVEEHQFANTLFRTSGGVLFGRKTYEGFVDYWDTLDLTDLSIPLVGREFATIFRGLPRVVFSRTLTKVDSRTTLIAGNLAVEVSTLKQQPGNDLLLVCGPELLATLVAHGFVDEYRLMIKPTALGQGKALFGEVKDKLRLKLLSIQSFQSGTVMHHYQTDGQH
jgi:dihydrofolate reductase